MRNRTWACIACGKTYRREFGVDVVPCAICGTQCEPLHTKIRVPSPKKRKQWDEFWRLYKAELQVLNDYYAGNATGVFTLEILNMQLGEPDDERQAKRRNSGSIEVARHSTKVRKLFLEGYSKSFIARELKVSYGTVLKILQDKY